MNAKFAFINFKEKILILTSDLFVSPGLTNSHQEKTHIFPWYNLAQLLMSSPLVFQLINQLIPRL